MPGSALLAGSAFAASARSTKGDVAILRLVAAVELIEADLRQQYSELGGQNGGNAAHIAALSNLDGDIPQYISDNTDDELTSWYVRYRSRKNRDLGATLPQAVTIRREPAIPVDATDTPPHLPAPVPPIGVQERRMEAIANTAGFHFAYIEQGGLSLYSIMALKATSLEVLRIIAAIGGWRPITSRCGTTRQATPWRSRSRA